MLLLCLVYGVICIIGQSMSIKSMEESIKICSETGDFVLHTKNEIRLFELLLNEYKGMQFYYIIRFVVILILGVFFISIRDFIALFIINDLYSKWISCYKYSEKQKCVILECLDKIKE